MAPEGGRAVTRSLMLGLALLGLLCASAPAPASAEDTELVALQAESQKLFEESRMAISDAQAAQAVAEKSGEEADKAAAEKARYASDVEAKYAESLKAYMARGGSEQHRGGGVCPGRHRTGQAEERVRALVQAVQGGSRGGRGSARRHRQRGDKADADKAAEYAREVEAKHQEILKVFVERGAARGVRGRGHSVRNPEGLGESEEDHRMP